MKPSLRNLVEKVIEKARLPVGKQTANRLTREQLVELIAYLDNANRLVQEYRTKLKEMGVEE